MCSGFLVNGGDDGDPVALLLQQAAALISACHIEPQVPLCAISGLYFLNLTFLL